MKKYITYLLATALVGSAFVSCTERFQEGEMRVSTHKVHFSASEVETRTGLSIDGTTVTPDWNKTALESIHLFEIDANDAVAYGETIAITTSEDKATAHFEADFPTDMSIIVDPSDPEEDSGAKGASNGATKGTRVSPYRYAAIIAQKPDKNNLTFVVPSEQHPDAETLKDPDADFLIGYSRKAYDTEHFFDEPVVDLYFDRVAALGRLAISNFAEGEKVQSVTINAQNGLTGSASYADIDFENGSVSFVREEGPGAITLVYDGGMDIPADGPFYAYFVAIPGSATLTSVEVVTDQYRYTKTIEGGKELTFSEKAFKSMNLDLSTATREEVAPSGLTWYKASVLEDGIDYLIVSAGQALKNNDGATAAVSVTDNEGVITLEAADPTIVWTATAHQEMTGDNGQGGVVAGHFTLTNDSKYLLRDSQEITLGDAIPSAKPKYAVWDYDGTYLKHESSETMTFYCYYDGGWATGYTQNGAAPTSSIKTVQIYTSRTPQAMAFSETTVNYDVDAGGDFTEPELTGAKTTVTYSSSNEAVASVDPATGEVTIKKAGTVTITAAAAGNAEYQAGTASYTIIASSSAIDTFYLASEIVVGESYMVVSGGYAVTTDGSTLGTVPVTVTDGIIQISAAEVALFEAAAHIEYYEGTSIAGHYTLANGGKYLQRYSNQTTQTGAIGAENGKYYVWDYDGEHLYQISRTGNQGTYYFYYSSGWTFDYQSAKNAYLYTTTKQLQPQHLSFSSESVTAILGQSFTAPTLSGAKTTVSYASNDANVATVASDGTVTLVGVGTTTITATAAASDEYNAGSASYTLKVTDGSAPTWYKADEIVAGETYMIISNGNALKLDGTSIATVADASFSGASFQYEEDENLIWTAAASSGKFTFKSGSRFISRSSTSISTSSSSGAAFSYDGTRNYLTVAGSSSTYYLYYSESQGSWMFSTSSGNTHTAAVYTMSPQLLPRNLAFSSVSVTHDLATQGTNVEEPTLSGVTDGVEYSSSNTSVATVNATTGEVTLAGITGSVVITASASNTDTYKAETVSYTIRVTDSSAPVTTATYTKVTSSTDLVVGEKYLLVYESGSKVFKPTLNGSNYATTGNALDVSITDETIVSDEYEDCQMTLEDGYYFYVASVSRYLYPTYNNMGAEETKSSSHSFSISISNGTATITRTSNNTTYNLRYSTSSSYFQASSSSANVALYKLENP